MDNQMRASAERQAQIDQAMDAFLKQGGQIQVLESFVYQPLPARKHPEPKIKAKKILLEQEEGEQARGKAIAKLAETMTCREVSEQTGIPKATLWSMSKRFGFSFASAPRGRTDFSNYDDEKDIALAERIRALQKIGVTRNKATSHLKIGHTTMSRIMNKFGIVFSAGGPRKAK